MSKYDFAVYIGRFQPLHLGHQHIIDGALKRAKHVVVLIGSADSSRSIRDPWSFQDRCFMFQAVYRKELKSGRLILEPIQDHTYNNEAWVAQVQSTVDKVVLRTLNGPSFATQTLHGTRDASVALAGFAKDHTSFYLKLFPTWEQMAIGTPDALLNATDVRDAYFHRLPDWEVVGKHCDERMQQWLRMGMVFPEFEEMIEERIFVWNYKQSWANAPFPPTFNTADAVVVQSGHVLLVERGDFPGKGQLALPGGYANQWERLRDSAVRELKEETKISDAKGELPPAMLESFIDGPPVLFDAPHRDPRGRVITHATLFRCPDRRTLFKVKGSDDAKFARWYPLAQVKAERSRMFADHYAILQTMIGI